ncbi:MAG: DUF3017 domain-containing protein [Frankia sp.]
MRRPSALRREPVLSGLLIGVGLGLLWVYLDHWRQGLIAIALVLAAGGVLRLLLPTRAVGLLAVRSRLFDVAMLAALSAGILSLTLAVPLPHS